MSRRIRLIASDLDGTLLLNGAQTLQPGTCELIRRLNRKGISFLAASGRQYANLQRLFAPVKDEIGYMCENGCLSFFQGEMIHKETMSRELGQEIMRAIWEREGCEILLSGVNTSYLQPKKMSYYYHMRDVVKNNVTLVPDIFQVQEEYMKISVYEEKGIDGSAGYWKERFGDRLTVVTSGYEWLDMMPKKVNKGLGLKKILEYLGIAPEECMAIGDNYNDMEMLELAGHPVAMKTAVPAVRAVCREETDTVEHLLERLLAE
jgi:Cof subfamily protein (haloacid dehalogenase superfamily)